MAMKNARDFSPRLTSESVNSKNASPASVK
jgi:hypothetical protein